MKVFLGEFEVVDKNNLGAPILHIGKNVTITIHMGDYGHSIQIGDSLPLFTEVPDANSSRVNGESSC